MSQRDEFNGVVVAVGSVVAVIAFLAAWVAMKIGAAFLVTFSAVATTIIVAAVALVFVYFIAHLNFVVWPYWFSAAVSLPVLWNAWKPVFIDIYTRDVPSYFLGTLWIESWWPVLIVGLLTVLLMAMAGRCWLSGE